MSDGEGNEGRKCVEHTQGSLCWKTMDDTAQVEAGRRGTSGAGFLGSSGLVLLKRSGFAGRVHRICCWCEMLYAAMPEHTEL